jgi:quercetin dioxygenase-like cupin family protein
MNNNIIHPPKVSLSVEGDPEIQLSCVSNVYIRMMHFKHTGDIEEGHTHPFDHVSLLSFGKAKVTVDGNSKTFEAPQMIFIAKEKVHMIEALQDGTVMLCIHAIRDGERVEDIIDPKSLIIPPGAAGIEFLQKYDLAKFITDKI